MRILVSLVLLTTVLNGFAQTDTVRIKKKQHPAVSINYLPGKVIPHTEFVAGDNLLGKPLNHFESYAIKFLWQNPGYEDWQKVHHAPYYGFGVSVSDFHDPVELGYPVSVYGDLGIPVFRLQKFALYTDFQFGIATNWEHYDSINNPKNLSVGGNLTVHLNIGMNAYIPLTRRLELGAGIHFIHFSNGGFERPNRGLNVYSPSVELKYRFTDRPDLRAVKMDHRLERSNDLYLMLGYGDHQLVEHELDTNYFAVGGISAIYFIQMSNAFRLGAGTDINYWWGLNAAPDGTIGPRKLENFTTGLILQPEMIIGKMTLTGGIGLYATHRNYGNFKQTYQRLGVRYDIYRNYSLGINVRSVNFMLAEFLEFNIGYRFRWKK